MARPAAQARARSKPSSPLPTTNGYSTELPTTACSTTTAIAAHPPAAQGCSRTPAPAKPPRPPRNLRPHRQRHCSGRVPPIRRLRGIRAWSHHPGPQPTLNQTLPERRPRHPRHPLQCFPASRNQIHHPASTPTTKAAAEFLRHTASTCVPRRREASRKSCKHWRLAGVLRQTQRHDLISQKHNRGRAASGSGERTSGGRARRQKNHVMGSCPPRPLRAHLEPGPLEPTFKATARLLPPDGIYPTGC